MVAHSGYAYCVGLRSLLVLKLSLMSVAKKLPYVYVRQSVTLLLGGRRQTGKQRAYKLAKSKLFSYYFQLLCNSLHKVFIRQATIFKSKSAFTFKHHNTVIFSLILKKQMGSENLCKFSARICNWYFAIFCVGGYFKRGWKIEFLSFNSKLTLLFSTKMPSFLLQF